MLGMAKDSTDVLNRAIEYLNEQGSYGMYLVDNMRAAKNV
jgi:hypothetical protein